MQNPNMWKNTSAPNSKAGSSPEDWKVSQVMSLLVKLGKLDLMFLIILREISK